MPDYMIDLFVSLQTTAQPQADRPTLGLQAPPRMHGQIADLLLHTFEMIPSTHK